MENCTGFYAPILQLHTALYIYFLLSLKEIFPSQPKLPFILL